MQETAGKMTKYICMAWVVRVVILDKTTWEKQTSFESENPFPVPLYMLK